MVKRIFAFWMAQESNTNDETIVSADVVLNEVNYTFYFDNAAECSDEMLIQMASELIEAATA